jgi:hypothetical protein
MMNPETAKTLVGQRRDELTRCAVESRQNREAGTSWLRRYLPRWHVSWTKTVLSPAGAPGAAGSTGHPDRPGRRGSSLVIIISAYR